MTLSAIDELAEAESSPQSLVDRRETIESRTGRSKVHGLWALGIAQRSLGDVSGSIGTLGQAKDLAKQQQRQAESVEIDISLAASIAMSGRPQEAEETLVTACQHESPLIRAHAQTQLAGIIARRGELASAKDLYELALPVLQAHEDARWLALLYSNLGLVLTYLGEFDQAEQALDAAATLYATLKRFSSHAEMVVNQAFVAVQRGDIVRGLELLDEAERLYLEHGLPLHTVIVDRARAMALGGLGRRAYELLVEQVPALSEGSRNLEAAETLVSAAQAAFIGGMPDEAAAVAEHAIAVLEGQRRDWWRDEARLLAFRAKEAAGGAVDAKTVLRLAAGLESHSHLDSAQQASWLACRAAVRSGDARTAELARIAGERLTSRLDSWLTSVDRSHSTALIFGRNNRHGEMARQLWRAANVVGTHRATLTTIESQVAASHVVRPIAELGLKHFHEHGSPPQIVRWLETFRIPSMRYPALTRSRDRSLEGLLAELRGVELEITQTTIGGTQPVDLQAERVRLERSLADRSLLAGAGGPAVSPATIPEIQSHLGDIEMVFVYIVDDEVHAIRLRSKSVRRVPLGDAATLGVEVRVLRSLLRRSAAAHDVDLPRIDHHLKNLRQRLLEPLNLVAEHVVVVPPPTLGALPWPAIAGPARSIVVSPTASTWMRTRTKTPQTRRRAVAVAGPDLVLAEDEVVAIAQQYPDAQKLVGSHASVAATLTALQEVDVAHLACHGTLRLGNPMFSALHLDDGPLNLYDVAGLDATPEVVVLSACDTATNQHEAGLDILGLSSVFVGAGTTSVIAPIVLISDSPSTVELMSTIHQSLAAGSSAAEACRVVIAQEPTATAASLMAFGA